MSRSRVCCGITIRVAVADAAAAAQKTHRGGPAAGGAAPSSTRGPISRTDEGPATPRSAPRLRWCEQMSRVMDAICGRLRNPPSNGWNVGPPADRRDTRSAARSTRCRRKQRSTRFGRKITRRSVAARDAPIARQPRCSSAAADQRSASPARRGLEDPPSRAPRGYVPAGSPRIAAAARSPRSSGRRRRGEHDRGAASSRYAARSSIGSARVKLSANVSSQPAMSPGSGVGRGMSAIEVTAKPPPAASSAP